MIASGVQGVVAEGGELTRHHVLERRVEGDGRLDGVGLGRCLQLADPGWARGVPLGPLGFHSPNIAQRHALRVERTAEKAFLLSDRV